MNDICFPGWIKSSPALAMASVLAQLLAEECASSALAVEAALPIGGGATARSGQRAFDEDMSTISGGSGEDGYGEPEPGDTPDDDSDSEDATAADAQHSRVACVDTGYLRMVDRLLELNAKELDSLPPAAMAVAATPYARRLSTAPVLRSPASAPAQAATARADILHDGRVRTLLRLSRLNDVLTRAEAAQPLISQRTAAAMVAFFAFAVSCRHGGLPAERTKGFFTECSALYATLLSKLRTLRLAAGVSLEDFTASLVACGLKLRDDDEVADSEVRSPGMVADGGPSMPFSARSNSSSSAPQAGASSSAAGAAANGGLGGPRTSTPAPLSRDKNLGLVGFGHRALDAVLVRCIPQDIDACAHDAIALGVLRGISLTHSHALVYLGPELVHHMHDLTDAFATSGHRRELAYKRVLSVLLEAISCSRVIDYERTNNWITAIIQETYVVRGLFQREVLHAHVVTATLTLLIRQYQEMAKECAAKVVELGSMPDFTEGDQLIELVWKALQDTIAAWEDAASASEKRPLTLFRHNIEIVVHHLLRTEVERLRCYYIITSATAAYHASLASLSSPTQASQQWRSPTSQPLGQSLDGRRRGSHAPPAAAAAAAAAPYVPSAEEEALRILICGNVVKFLLLPTSIMNALPRTDEADELRASLAEAAAQVLSVVTAREFNSRDGTGARGGNAAAAPPQRSFSLGSAAGLPSAGRGGVGNGRRASTAARAAAAAADLLAVSRRKAHFSNNFYRCIEDIMHELIQTVLQQHSAAPAAGSGASTDAVANSDSPPSTTATAAVPEAYGDPVLRGMVAAVCLQYMCATNHHLRSFAISEVMDAVVRLSARRGGAEEAAATAAAAPTPGPRLKAASGDDPKEARRQAEQRRARRLALCFDAMSAILVPAVVDVEAHEHLGSEKRAEADGLSRSGTSTSARGESRREEMARFGQLLCDTYVDALREHLWRAAETRDDKGGRSVLTPVMSVAVKAFVDLVLRVHERLRGMASMALTLVQEVEAAAIVDAPETTTVSRRSPAVIARDRARLLRAFNAERMSVVLLLRGVIQCMLSVAWPSSGLLYQRATDGGERPLDSTTTSAAMAPTAFAALGPFLRPLTLLLHLSTLFPARSLKQLCTHHQYARYLTLDDPSTSDQYVFHYYRRPSRAYVAVEMERHRGAGAVTAEDQMELECWSLFRSCWMMLSYYKYTAEALMAVHDGGLAPRDNTEVSAIVTAAAVLERDPLLSSAQCKQLRLIAASAAPLLRMCSSDVQQAMADIAVLLRYALAGGRRRRPVAAADVAVMNGTVHRELYKSLKRLCGGKKEDWQRLSTGELMLLQSIAELEVLRAAAGSVAQLTLYRHFEVREFVASAAIPEALGHILVTACEHYIHTVRSLLPAVAFHIVRTDLTQLVMLLSFAIVSVRESASRLALRIAHSFPDYAAHASALPLLWCVLDLLEAGSATQIEAFCDHVRFAAVPAVATDPHSAERRRHVVFVVDVAERWAATLQERAPQALFETAVKFMVIQQQECGERAATPAGGRHAGSRLAVLACQQTRSEASAMSATGGDAATPPLRGAAAAGHLVASEYAQTLLLHGRAQGTMQAAGWYASATRMQSTVLAELWAATRVSRRALAAAVAQRLESALLRPARAPFADGGYVAALPLVADPRGEGGNDDAAGAPEAEARVTRVALGSLDRAAVAASYAAAVALLVTGNGTPTGRRQLLQYLVQSAVQTFRSDVLCDAILSWKWLLCQDREAYLLPVLQEVDAALVWTAGNRLGLFDGYRASKYRQVQAGDVPLHSGDGAGAEDSGAGEVGVCVADNIDSASPHKLLFSFVADMYVEGGSPLCLSVEVLRQLYVTVAHVMQFHSVFSLRDEMFGETMRCLLVVGSVARLLREANMRRLRAGLVTVVPFAAIGALRQQWYKVLLRWFGKTPPSWYFARDPVLAREETVVVRALSQLVKEEADLLTRATLGFLDFSSGVHREEEMAVVHHWESLSVVRESVAALRQAADGGEAGLPKLIAQEQQRLLGLLQLLRVLMEHEVLRLSVWQAPRRTRKLPNTTPSAGWDRLIECADYHNPSVVVALVFRFSSIPAVRTAASRRVVAHPERYANVAEAVDLYLTEEVLRAGAPQLFVFRACTIVQALRLLDPRYTAYKTVTSYAIRSLLSQRSEQLIFYLPQLLQLLATDSSGSIEAFLVRTSAKSVMFAHQLLWSLQTEGQGSGALARKCQLLEKRVKAAFTPAEATFYKAEFAFVDLVTSLSGELMKFEKPQRKAKLRLRLKDDAFHAPPKSQHLYLPTDPEYRITGVIPHTAGAMQSAAKCPILVQFTCVPRAAADTRTPEEMDDDADEPVGATAAALSRPVVKACIFKMGDDCRQDQISLQLIGLMQRILCAVGVPSFLYPYRVVTTGQDSGIIECVPRSRSRNEIGKLVESNIAEYFVQTFGHPESVGFRRARENFVKSTAAYSVVSFILNIKDRHNGNIMIDADGNLVHIDFGFLFDTSPGGDMNFESSPFKLTTEMVQLIGMDVGGDSKLHSKTLARALVDEENYIYFKTLVNRCYLAVRQYAREICVMVELMLHSGLPCFKPKKTVADLAQRLAIDKNEIEAADYMRRRIHESRQNYRTVLYDYYQKVAEGIEM